MSRQANNRDSTDCKPYLQKLHRKNVHLCKYKTNSVHDNTIEIRKCCHIANDNCYHNPTKSFQMKP